MVSVVPALIALRETGLEPLTLEPKEGLALLNGTQMMSAIGALLLADADRLGRTASVVAAMSVEALLGTDVAFAAAYQLARPAPGAGRGRRRSCATSSVTAVSRRATTANDHKVQDPYSLALHPAGPRRRPGLARTTSAASSTSSSTPPPTIRSSFRAAVWPMRRHSRQAADV